MPDTDRPAPLTWFLEQQLVACVHPRSEANFQALARLGVGVVINLTEAPHDPALLQRVGLTELHLPVADFTAPTQAQLRQGVAAIVQALAAPTKVAVHCHGGLGRTGTLVACYFVQQGYAATAALAHVRAARPGSVETAAQEAAVADYAAAVTRC